jgi:2-isopropylmalate synthase
VPSADVPSETRGTAAPAGVSTEATIKIHVGDERVVATAEGNGPVNALDTALRRALGDRSPGLERIHLTDYKVRVLDTQKGTGAVTRVLIDTTNGDRTWTTIGVSENIIEASWQALYDSLVFGLLHTTV